MKRSDFQSDDLGWQRDNFNPMNGAPLPRRFALMLGAAAFLVVFILFGSVVMTHGFVYDDYYLIVKNPYLESWQNFTQFFSHDATQMSGIQAASGYYRPLSMVLLQILFSFFHLAAWKYHFFNLVVHALNSFLVGFLILQVSGRKGISFLSMLIFAVHPVHIEAFVLICSYMGAVATTAALLSVLFFLQNNFTGRSEWMLLSLGSYAAAIFFKEDTIVLPLMLLALDRFYFRKSALKMLKQAAMDLVPFIVIALLYLAARKIFVEPGAAFGFWQNPAQINVSYPAGWVGQLASVFLIFKAYFLLWIWPSVLTIYHVIHLPDTVQGWVFFCGEWALIMVVILKMYKHKMMRLALAWFFVFSLLICNIIPIGGLFADRLIYLPSVGLAWITAWAINALRGKNPQGNAKQILYGLVALLVVGGLSYQSYVYAQTWKSDISIWEHARKINPYSSYPHSQLAKAYQESGDPHKAAALYKKASELTERGNSNIILRRRAAMAYGEAKEYELAIREYRALLRQSPQLGDVAFEMGWTYLLSGNEPEAEATFNRVLEKNPEHGWSYFGLAEMAFKKGDDEKGRNLYTLALNHSSDSVLVQTIIKNLQVRSKQS